MAKLTVDGVGEFEVGQGKRLVLALEDEAGVDQLHACGATLVARLAASSSWQASPTR